MEIPEFSPAGSVLPHHPPPGARLPYSQLLVKYLCDFCVFCVCFCVFFFFFFGMIWFHTIIFKPNKHKNHIFIANTNKLILTSFISIHLSSRVTLQYKLLVIYISNRGFSLSVERMMYLRETQVPDFKTCKSYYLCL